MPGGGREVIRFGDFMEYYEKYLVNHIEAVLDCPGLLSLSRPVVGRFDIAFDVECKYPVHLLHSTRDLPIDGRLAKDKRNSNFHTKASTKSHKTEFTRYYSEKVKGGLGSVRFELRRRRQGNVKSALMGGDRNGEIGDLCNHDLVRKYLEKSFKHYRFYPMVPILPLHIAIERETNVFAKGKLENCLKWNKTKKASLKHRELRKMHGIVIGSLKKDSFELLHVYEAFMNAFEAAW